jgi:hypothetical protein
MQESCLVYKCCPTFVFTSDVTRYALTYNKIYIQFLYMTNYILFSAYIYILCIEQAKYNILITVSVDLSSDIVLIFLCKEITYIDGNLMVLLVLKSNGHKKYNAFLFEKTWNVTI